MRWPAALDFRVGRSDRWPSPHAAHARRAEQNPAYRPSDPDFLVSPLRAPWCRSLTGALPKVSNVLVALAVDR
jgi:hypothetical protein